MRTTMLIRTNSYKHYCTSYHSISKLSYKQNGPPGSQAGHDAAVGGLSGRVAVSGSGLSTNNSPIGQHSGCGSVDPQPAGGIHP
jgi:hypothetical protein